MKRLNRFAIALALCGTLSAQAAMAPAGPDFQRGTALGAGKAAWVKVADGPLLFTGQVTMEKPAGGARAQAGSGLTALGNVLSQHGSHLRQVARLIAYVADGADVREVEAVVGETFAATPVAFSLVRTPLAVKGARVAFEAVAASTVRVSGVQASRDGAVLPAGGKVFISGQAVKGGNLGDAVKLTMAGLQRSLEHRGLAKADVVQVKAFIQPFRDQAAAVKEIAASFEGGPVPPIALVEWQSELFAEIELVAAAKPSAVAPAEISPLNFAWLPWLPKSTRYCNVCTVAPGTPLIFLSAIDGGDGEPRVQMKTAFERLGSTLFDAGASFRTLVKATYYLDDAKARPLLTEIRDVYFDPTRPPAASALGVRSFGHPDRAVMLDLIAAPIK